MPGKELKAQALKKLDKERQTTRYYWCCNHYYSQDGVSYDDCQIIACATITYNGLDPDDPDDNHINAICVMPYDLIGAHVVDLLSGLGIDAGEMPTALKEWYTQNAQTLPNIYDYLSNPDCKVYGDWDDQEDVYDDVEELVALQHDNRDDEDFVQEFCDYFF